MAKFKWEGSDEYKAKLSKLYSESTGMIKAAVYDGAKIVADNMKAAVNEHNQTGELSRSMTLTPMRKEKNFIYTKISWVGYDKTRPPTRRFPHGVPNLIKAAALESGTSRGQKATHFITKTIFRSKKAAIAAMEAKVDEQIKKLGL